ncbi:ribonuclease domain-containing protein [Streptomyces sp. NPDC004296]|uniref:ribonuclease domain-containing protein n=1 Tax=Streptomyces sp. NPDC004296 TaxID=3364697 RepID=UPI0036821F74
MDPREGSGRSDGSYKRRQEVRGDATGWGEQWHGPNLSMETFQNTGKGGAHALPTHSSSGEPIRYREYGAPASPDNPKPGGERIVFGSDGSIYYSPTHYQTYIVVEGPKR